MDIWEGWEVVALWTYGRVGRWLPCGHMGGLEIICRVPLRYDEPGREPLSWCAHPGMLLEKTGRLCKQPLHHHHHPPAGCSLSRHHRSLKLASLLLPCRVYGSWAWAGRAGPGAKQAAHDVPCTATRHAPGRHARWTTSTYNGGAVRAKWLAGRRMGQG